LTWEEYLQAAWRYSAKTNDMAKDGGCGTQHLAAEVIQASTVAQKTRSAAAATPAAVRMPLYLLIRFKPILRHAALPRRHVRCTCGARLARTAVPPASHPGSPALSNAVPASACLLARKTATNVLFDNQNDRRRRRHGCWGGAHSYTTAPRHKGLNRVAGRDRRQTFCAHLRARAHPAPTTHHYHHHPHHHTHHHACYHALLLHAA